MGAVDSDWDLVWDWFSGFGLGPVSEQPLTTVHRLWLPPGGGNVSSPKDFCLL